MFLWNVIFFAPRELNQPDKSKIISAIPAACADETLAVEMLEEPHELIRRQNQVPRRTFENLEEVDQDRPGPRP